MVDNKDNSKLDRTENLLSRNWNEEECQSISIFCNDFKFILYLGEVAKFILI